MATKNTGKEIVYDIFPRNMANYLWAGGYDKALPVYTNNFDLHAILPAVFFMFKFGYRRGKGKFKSTFMPLDELGKPKSKFIAINDIVNKLGKSEKVVGFNTQLEQQILGDLLLCYSLENKNKHQGHLEKVQRVIPTHFISHWIDLPENNTWLRYVPEMIVALLANQRGAVVENSENETTEDFPVVANYQNNLILKAFMTTFLNGEPFTGIDEITMISMCHLLKQAPERAKISEEFRISNQRPIAEQSSKRFSSDIRTFIKAYANVLPRQTFVDVLEACISINMSTIIFDTATILNQWKKTGRIIDVEMQQPTRLFVDCSSGLDWNIRDFSEQHFQYNYERVLTLPVIFMLLRLLDWYSSYLPSIKEKGIVTTPYATEWVNELGDILHDRHSESDNILFNMMQKCEELYENLGDEFSEVKYDVLKNKEFINPAFALSSALTSLLGRNLSVVTINDFLNSSMLTNQANGMAKQRRSAKRQADTNKVKTKDVRSIVFTDPVLDYLVHNSILHNSVNKNVQKLSFREFIAFLKERYGFLIDEAPAGFDIPYTVLHKNRSILERRLRDLGLLVGVNDAEAMKCVTPRFNSENGGA